jgi:putative glutamine amidotransferase
MPGAGLTAVAWADDGVIEAIESATGFTLGVQWHPEEGDDLRLFSALVRAAELRASEHAVESFPDTVPDLLAEA